MKLTKDNVVFREVKYDGFRVYFDESHHTNHILNFNFTPYQIRSVGRYQRFPIIDEIPPSYVE